MIYLGLVIAALILAGIAVIDAPRSSSAWALFLIALALVLKQAGAL